MHSAKDLPTLLPEGVAIAGFLEREDVRDALISAVADSIAALPHGARLGAASLRRQAQARRLRPDLRVELLRGNVETRLRKAETGEIDATLLALAGLKRLGLAHRASAILDIEAFLPAVGQGAIALTARAADARALGRAGRRSATPTPMIALTAERAFLAELEGSCRTPIAGHARLEGGALILVGQVLREDGSESFDVRVDRRPRRRRAPGRRGGPRSRPAASARRPALGQGAARGRTKCRAPRRRGAGGPRGRRRSYLAIFRGVFCARRKSVPTARGRA